MGSIMGMLLGVDTGSGVAAAHELMGVAEVADEQEVQQQHHAARGMMQLDAELEATRQETRAQAVEEVAAHAPQLSAPAAVSTLSWLSSMPEESVLPQTAHLEARLRALDHERQRIRSQIEAAQGAGDGLQTSAVQRAVNTTVGLPAVGHFQQSGRIGVADLDGIVLERPQDEDWHAD
jgi:hypothetical protein